MKKTYTCLLLLFIICYTHHTYAQNKISGLQGKIINENYAAAEAATIALIRFRDSSNISSTVSGKNGVFEFNGIKPDKYLLQITKVGYHKMISGPYLVSTGRTIVIDSIRLQLAEVNLKEVVITDKRKYYDVRPDKTVLNLDRSILATGTSVLNILNTAPGVKVNSAGDIFLRAGQRAAIFVNGKQVRLEGDDLSSYLQTLPTADVEQIELIQNPSAKYDASGSGGIINVILKKGKNVGFNGSIITNAEYGTFGKGGASFNGNYRTQKLNIFGGLGYRYAKTDHTIDNLRNVDEADITTFNTHYYNTQRTPSYDYRLGTDYFIDATHTIGFLIKGSHETSRFDKQTNTYMSVNGVSDSTITTLSNLKRTRENINYNLNYAGALGHTKQTLSADADLSILNRNANENIVSTSYPAINAGAMTIPAFSNDTLRNIAPTRIVNESIKVDYSNPITKNSRLDAGIKASYLKSDNTQTFDALTNNQYVPVPLLTSRFYYTEKKGAVYANYSGTLNKFNYNVGLRAERTISDANTPTATTVALTEVKRDFTNLFPSVRLTYNMANSQQLTFNYNRRIDPPAYESLNPTISYQDNYNFRVGNAYLRPEYTNYFELAYTGTSRYKVSMYASTTSDFFDYSYFYQNDASKILVTTKLNLKRESNYGVKLDLPLQITKCWNINFNPDFSYFHFKDYAGALDKWTKDLVLDLNQDFAISKTISATLYSHYESSTFYGLYSNRPVFYATPGVSMQVLHKAGTLSFTYNDIFNTLRDKSNTMYQNLDISTYDKRETRIARLSFVYNFGKRTVKGARKHTVGNSDEVKRMSGGGGN
jgi:iron complex outermembrane receptor protein